MANLNLEVLTPDKAALQIEANAVYVQGSEGRLGILPNHTALISLLDFGTLVYQSKDGEGHLLCGDGMVETVDNRVTVLVRSAENEDDINVTRAKEALERAKSRIHSRDSEINMTRADLALKRALLRLKFTKSM